MYLIYNLLYSTNLSVKAILVFIYNLIRYYIHICMNSFATIQMLYLFSVLSI